MVVAPVVGVQIPVKTASELRHVETGGTVQTGGGMGEGFLYGFMGGAWRWVWSLTLAFRGWMDDGWIGHGRILENIFVNRLVGGGKWRSRCLQLLFFFLFTVATVECTDHTVTTCLFTNCHHLPTIHPSIHPYDILLATSKSLSPHIYGPSPSPPRDRIFRAAARWVSVCECVGRRSEYLLGPSTTPVAFS